MTAFDVSQSQINLSQYEKRAMLACLLREKAKNTKSYHPLSYGQQALWFLYQNAPESPAYNTAFPVRIHSDVNVAALKTAFEKLIARHPSLRTTFKMQNGEPVQEVHGYQELYFQETDASAWSWEEVSAKVIEAYQRPFDLERGPLLRVDLFTRSDRDRVLLLTIHHIVTDGWSLWVLLEELRQLYSAQNSGTQAFLPPLEKSYSDYVNWQREMLTAEGEDLWNYWQEKLAGDLPDLNLPADRPRPPVQTYQGASHLFELTEELSQKLKKLAESEGATLYTTLLAAFEVLLHRYTGQEDILVGSPSAGRNQSEFANSVGYFVNPIVLRGDLSANPTFKTFLSQIRQTVFEAMAHQDYPFPLLVERLQPNRDPSRSPIFQSLFVLQKPQSKKISDLIISSNKGLRIDWGGLELEFLTISTEEGQFDLTLEMVEGQRSLAGFLKYDTSLFDPQTITRMVKHFQTLLESIVANPEQLVSELPLLGVAEKNQLLVEWNDTSREYSHPECIHHLFEARVEQTPDAIAVVFQDRQLTYRELNIRANQLAHYLQSLGVEPETPVAICTDRSLEMVVGLLGILKAGGAYVPLDPTYPKERLSFAIEDVKPPVILTQKHLLDRLPGDRSLVVCLDSEWESIAKYSRSNPTSSVTANNLAYTIYTSGSTGKPKGVLIAHKGLCNLALAQIEAFDVRPESRVLQFASFSFDASVSEVFMALCCGSSICLASSEELLPGSNLIQLFEGQKITHVTLPPSALAVMPKAELPNLKVIIVAGEICNSNLVTEWSVGRRFFNAYGPTESTVCATIAECNAEGGQPSIGRPIANTQVYILDRYLQPVPAGVKGELHISGIGLARGYLNRPELTEEKFIPNPFSDRPDSRLYKTGDLARYLPDGNIEILGRIDHQVKIRGYRIELGEIEEALTQHPAVEKAVIVAQEDNSSNKCLVAYVVAKQSSIPTQSQLRDFLVSKLPHYMVPAFFVVLDSFPLTPNGKLNRKALPAPDRSTVENNFVAPRDTLEQQLAQIWSKVLNVYPIGVRDNFFNLGGHSLSAVRLMGLIQQQFEKNLPLATLFQAPTIEELARVLRSQTNSLSWSPLVPIQPNGSETPIFCFPGAGGNVIYFYDLARNLGTDRPFYGLQSIGLDGESEPYTQVEDMAAHYIKEIKKVQPQGPYFLAGHSSGGLVAFETAQQLQRQGEEIALVAILDTEAPFGDRKEIGSDWNNTQWLMRITSIIERFLGKNLGISYELLESKEAREQLSYVGERLKKFEVLPPEAGEKQVHGILEVFKASYQAYARYAPQQIYPTPIALFRARDTHSEDFSSNESVEIQQKPTWGWEQFSLKPVKFHSIPGDHVTMMAEPNVRVLAETLKALLEESVNAQEI